MKCEMRSKWFYQFNSSVDWFEVSELDLLVESTHLMSFDNWPNWIKCQTVERDLNWVKLNEIGGKWIQLMDQVISKMFSSRFLTRLKHLGTIRWWRRWMTLMKSTTSNRSKWHRIASIRDVYLLTLNAIVVCYGSLVNPRVTSKVCRHQIVQVCLCRFKNNRLFNPETKRPVRGNIWSSARNVLACQLPAIFHWTVALKIQSLLLKIQVAAVVNQPIEFPTAAQFHLFKPMARP